MKNVIIVLLLVTFAVVGYGQRKLTSTNVNGLNVLVSVAKETTNAANAVYTSAFDGASINGRKVIIGWLVTDSTNVANTTNAQARVDLQGSYDGTNFVNVLDSVITSKRFNGTSALTTPKIGTADLSLYTLPWYRLALVPTNGTLGTVGNGSTVTVPKFKWYISGGK